MLWWSRKTLNVLLKRHESRVQPGSSSHINYKYRSSTELASCLREVRTREKVAQVANSYYACCILVWSTKSFFVSFNVPDWRRSWICWSRIKVFNWRVKYRRTWPALWRRSTTLYRRHTLLIPSRWFSGTSRNKLLSDHQRGCDGTL